MEGRVRLAVGVAKHRRQVHRSSGQRGLRGPVGAAEQRRTVGLRQGYKLRRRTVQGKVWHGRRQKCRARAAVARSGTLGV
jgi:hypothetical protein